MVMGNLTGIIEQISPAVASALAAQPWLLPLIALQIIMKFAFYPVALYYSARRSQKSWFTVLIICFAILNDFGLLAILYLIFNRKKHK